MNDKDFNKKLLDIMEYGMGPEVMPGAVQGARPSAEPKVEGSVEFKQHKNTDKGSVSIEASGDDMQELAKVLKMAGLTLPQDMYKDEPEADDEPEAHDEPEVQVVEPDSDEESPCGTSDADASYSTDKEVLVNYIKDKLAKRLS